MVEGSAKKGYFFRICVPKSVRRKIRSPPHSWTHCVSFGLYSASEFSQRSQIVIVTSLEIAKRVEKLRNAVEMQERFGTQLEKGQSAYGKALRNVRRAKP